MRDGSFPFGKGIGKPTLVRGHLPLKFQWITHTKRLMVILVMLFVSGGSLVLRLRRSVGEERQQLKWVVYSVALLAFTLSATILVIIVVQSLEGVRVFFSVLFPLIPISVGIAIFKYRLYEIDFLINRTLVYGSLTATLVTVYLGGVAVLQ